MSVFSGEAYLCFLASRSKSLRSLHPNAMSVWAALKYAMVNGFRHLFFLDGGLPLVNSAFRELILSFGGKPVSKYRWFRLLMPVGINRFLSWFYNDK